MHIHLKKLIQNYPIKILELIFLSFFIMNWRTFNGGSIN